MSKCLNCDHPVSGKYCSHCGQKTATRRITVHNILHDLPHAVFHVDKGAWKNILSVMRPGKTVREYLKGKRIVYFNPFIFFLLSLGLILYLEHLLHKDIRVDFNLTLDTGIQNNFDSTAFFNHYFKYFYFGCLFIFALPNTLVFRRSTGYNYAEHVVAQTFIMGFVNIVYLLLIPFPVAYHFPVNLVVPILLFTFTLLVFHRKNIFITILNSLLALALQFVFFIVTLLLTGIVSSLIASALDGH